MRNCKPLLRSIAVLLMILVPLLATAADPAATIAPPRGADVVPADSAAWTDPDVSSRPLSASRGTLAQRLARGAAPCDHPRCNRLPLGSWLVYPQAAVSGRRVETRPTFWAPYSRAVADAASGDLDAAVAWYAVAARDWPQRFANSKGLAAYTRHWQPRERALIESVYVEWSARSTPVATVND